MAHTSTPHFQNASGATKLQIGAKEFVCEGAIAPFDHPHIFIDMGASNDAVCPYCSTLYSFNPKLKSDQSIAIGALA
jgi:uncharacterized Zn-finger protein